MGFSKKTGKGRLDKYYFLAKGQGFRARSAFKLIQLNKRFRIFDQARVVIDLCAAPGGWLQVAAKYMPVSNVIVGVDLVPIKPISGVKTIVADITTDRCRSELKKELKNWKSDVILHDGAPNVGRAWIQDAYSQAELVLHSLKLATEFLIAGGTFVTKVFRSKDYNSLLWVFKQLFNKVEATKPSSSRDVSAEIFVVCQGYKCPEVIDSKLLDPRHVFEEINETDKAKKTSLANLQRPTRNRGGYDDGSILLHKKITVNEFIANADPEGIFADYHEIIVPDDSSPEILQSLKSKPAIKEMFNDLKVLGLGDIKVICKWHARIRKLMGLDVAPTTTPTMKAIVEPLTAFDEAEATSNLAKKLSKKIQKRQLERKAKERLRLQKKMESACDILDGSDIREEFDSQPPVIEMTEDDDDNSSSETDPQTDFLNEKQRLWYSDPIFATLNTTGNSSSSSSNNNNNNDNGKPINSDKKELPSVSEGTKSSAKPKAVKPTIIAKDNILDQQILGTPSGMSLATRICEATDGEDEAIDDSFNRYAFEDDDQLPNWFVEDENHHNTPQIPITKEGIALLRQKLRELENRPSKKILEAQGRNKQRALRQLNRIRKTADAIAESEEIGEKQKGEQIEKLMRKAGVKKKKAVKLVIAKGKNRAVKGRPKGVKGRYKMVDRRMKKEVRAQKRINSKK